MFRRCRAILATILLLAPLPAFGQGALLQGGPWQPGHIPQYVGQGSSQAVVQDGGGAGGGSIGVNPAEIGLTARGTGTPPYAGQGTGPFGTNFCDYDAPINNATGYHFLCFSANAQGGGLLAYGAAGVASQLPLSVNLNGVVYPFPFAIGGIVGPSTSVVGDTACWNNTVGTLLKDCGPSALAYDTNALAQAATIGATVNNVTVWNYRAGFTGGGGVYRRVGSAPAHLLYFQSADGAFWELTAPDGDVNPKQAGAYGDDSHDDTTAINNAALYMSQKQVRLFFTTGVYRHTGLEFNPYCNSGRGCDIDFDGGAGFVTLRYVGAAAGKNVAFTSTGGGIYNASFGRSGRPVLTGSNLAAESLSVNFYVGSTFRAFLGDSTTNGAHITAAVLSNFDLVISSNDQVHSFVTKPATAVRVDGGGGPTTACRFMVRIEGMLDGMVSNGMQFSYVTGTSEGNSGIGYSGSSLSTFNVIENLFMEANGTVPDFVLQEGNATITNSNATGLLLNQGGQNKVFGGEYNTLTIAANTINTSLTNVQVDTTYTNGGSNTAAVGLRVAGTFQDNSIGVPVPLAGSSVAATIAAGQTRFVNQSLSATEGDVKLLLPMAGTFRGLRLRSAGSPGVGETYVATLRINASDTTLTCIIVTGQNECLDSTHAVATAVADVYDVKVVASAGAATTALLWAAIVTTKP